MVKICVSFEDEEEKKDILKLLKTKSIKKVSKTYYKPNGFNKIYIELNN